MRHILKTESKVSFPNTALTESKAYCGVELDRFYVTVVMDIERTCHRCLSKWRHVKP